MGEDRWWTWPAATGAAVLAGVLLVVAAWGAAGGWVQPSGVGAAPISAPARVDAPRAAPVRPDAASGPETASPPPAAGAATVVVQPEVGDCIDLGADLSGAAAGGSAVGVVSCEGAHHLEVTALVDPAGVYAGAPTPSQWQTLLAVRCPALIATYLNGRFDPYGRLTLRVSAPDEAAWGTGDRLGECLVGAGNDGSGLPAVTSGGAAGLDQTPTWAPGDCLALVPGTDRPPRPIGCDEAHELEVTARLDVGGPAATYPDQAAWDAFAARCAPSAEAHVGRALSALGAVPLAPVAVHLPLESWLAGRRTTFCAVVELDAAGEPVVRHAPLGR